MLSTAVALNEIGLLGEHGLILAQAAQDTLPRSVASVAAQLVRRSLSPRWETPLRPRGGERPAIPHTLFATLFDGRQRQLTMDVRWSEIADLVAAQWFPEPAARWRR